VAPEGDQLRGLAVIISGHVCEFPFSVLKLRARAGGRSQTQSRAAG
jgi:hypothetical protein